LEVQDINLDIERITFLDSGPWSVESPFFASTVPDQLAAATTSLSGASVIIQWQPTPNDHMTAVTSYRVKLLNKAGQLVEDGNICQWY
jgi:hypothetical protein